MRKKQYFIYGLNIVQVSIFFFLLITLTGSLSGYKELYNRYKNFFDEGRTLMYQGTFESMDYEREEKLTKEIDNIVDEFIKKDKITFKFNPQYSIGMFKELESSHSTKVSNEFLKRYPIDIKEGRNFTDEELDGISGDIIPVIIGNDLKDRFNIGDVLEQNIGEDSKIIDNEIVTKISETDEKIVRKLYKFKVVGIAEPNTMAYLDSSDAVLSGYRDDMIYYPNYKEETKIYKGEKLISKNKDTIISGFSYIETKTEEDTKEILEVLNTELKNRDNLGYVYYPEKDNLTLKSLRESYITLLIFCGVFITFSIIGVIGSMIYSIRESEKEYGILSALGAKKRYLIAKNLIKVLALLVVSLVLALGVTAILRGYMLEQEAMLIMEGFSESTIQANKYLFLIDGNLIKNMGIALLMVFTTSSIPIVYKISSYNIVDLIRGK
ncbi:MAG: ABC transporter permease [Clostridium sp.]|uniref:ABC transporter permease n=1 Tax=Clostridium sp. TaxID=1506 RepID=UPI003F2BAAAC